MDRLLLTVGFLAAVVLLWLLMLKGWRGRVRRQGDLPPPPAPPQVAGPVVLPATAGLFVGTTFADDWLDRVAVHDLAHRAAGWLRLTTDGIVVEREGLPDLYVPYDVVEGVSLGDALAGKVIGRGGMVLVDWRLGGRLLTSGFRADDHAVHRRVVDAVTAHLPVRPSADAPDPVRSDPEAS
jgi:hypothetical protein